MENYYLPFNPTKIFISDSLLSNNLFIVFIFLDNIFSVNLLFFIYFLYFFLGSSNFFIKAEKRKLQINTLSLSKITNDYLEKIKKQAVFPSQEVACFVHTASILLFIKSRSLLPILSYLDEEETDAEFWKKDCFYIKY